MIESSVESAMYYPQNQCTQSVHGVFGSGEKQGLMVNHHDVYHNWYNEVHVSKFNVNDMQFHMIAQ